MCRRSRRKASAAVRRVLVASTRSTNRPATAPKRSPAASLPDMSRPAPMRVEPVELCGERVVLAPLSMDHHDGLVAAVRDGELWRRWYTSIPRPEGMRAEIERRLRLLEAGDMLPWTVLRRDAGRAIGFATGSAPGAGSGAAAAPGGQACGMTTYMNIDAANHRVEIGSTWLAASAQRTGINAECKLLLLMHAFQTLEAIAVEFRTHWHNRQSREAILRLGAKQDGVLRSHQYAEDGSIRDTVCFSIIASEWPAVRAGLEYRLDAALTR